MKNALLMGLESVNYIFGGVIMSLRFDLGRLVTTAGVHLAMEENPAFKAFVSQSFTRYYMCDWGDTCEENAKLNDDSVDNGERILAVYKFNDSMTIWIITEWDRSATTILFPEEY